MSFLDTLTQERFRYRYTNIAFWKQFPSIERKSLKNGFSMPVYGLGTWHIGGAWEIGPQSEDSADVWAMRDIIDHRQVTHIDTAEMYGEGNTEKLIGVAMKGRDRSRMFYTSKVFETHMRYDDLIQACRDTLTRLRTDYLDLYLLHRYSPHVPLRESMRALETLKDMGLIRHVGVSNFGVEHLQEAQSYIKYNIVCNQVHYNLRFREPEHSGLLAYCQTHDIMLTAYRPIQKGGLVEDIPHSVAVLCKKYNKTPSQIALNWLVAQKNVVVVCKTKRMRHLDENLGALGWYMTPEDIEWLRSEYPDQQAVSNVVPLG